MLQHLIDWKLLGGWIWADPVVGEAVLDAVPVSSQVVSSRVVSGEAGNTAAGLAVLHVNPRVGCIGDAGRRGRGSVLAASPVSSRFVSSRVVSGEAGSTAGLPDYPRVGCCVDAGRRGRASVVGLNAAVTGGFGSSNGCFFSSAVTNCSLFTIWQAPPIGWVKFNCAGCDLVNPNPFSASLGLILRDAFGSCVLFAAGCYSFSKGVQAQLNALLLAAIFCSRLNTSYVIFELDNRDIFSIFNNGSQCNWESIYIVRRIRLLIAGKTVGWNLVDQSGNRTAQFLAQAGADLDCLVIDKVMPPQLRVLCFGDKQGFPQFIL